MLEDGDFPSWDPETLTTCRQLVAKILRPRFVSPSIDEICCILLEPERLAGPEGISYIYWMNVGMWSRRCMDMSLSR
jgi:hypothetical protein